MQLCSRVLFGVTLLIVAAIVFTPGPPAPEEQQRLARWFDEVHRTWMPGWITFGLTEFAANIVMFAPLGFFGALAVTSRRALVIPACAAFSVAIELVQGLALPGRDGTWHDVVANTVGAALGWAIAVAVTRRRPATT